MAIFTKRVILFIQVKQKNVQINILKEINIVGIMITIIKMGKGRLELLNTAIFIFAQRVRN